MTRLLHAAFRGRFGMVEDLVPGKPQEARHVVVGRHELAVLFVEWREDNRNQEVVF
jgi:hypothetical protein